MVFKPSISAQFLTVGVRVGDLDYLLRHLLDGLGVTAFTFADLVAFQRQARTV